LVNETVSIANPFSVSKRNDVERREHFNQKVDITIRVFKSPTFIGVFDFPVLVVDVDRVAVFRNSRGTAVSTVVDGVHVCVAFSTGFPFAREMRSPDVRVAIIINTIANTNNEVCAIVSWSNGRRSTGHGCGFIGGR